jgi:Helix-turn-helix domain
VQHGQIAETTSSATLDRLVTPTFAAQMLAVSPAHVRRLLRRGLLPGVSIAGCWRISLDVIERVRREGLRVPHGA